MGERAAEKEITLKITFFIPLYIKNKKKRHQTYEYLADIWRYISYFNLYHI